jgi:hypothetical protein
MGEQVIDDAREFMGGDHNGRLRPEAGPHAPVVSSQAVVAATDRLGREPQDLSGPVAGCQSGPAQSLPPEIS